MAYTGIKTRSVNPRTQLNVCFFIMMAIGIIFCQRDSFSFSYSNNSNIQIASLQCSLYDWRVLPNMKFIWAPMEQVSYFQDFGSTTLNKFRNTEKKIEVGFYVFSLTQKGKKKTWKSFMEVESAQEEENALLYIYPRS